MNAIRLIGAVALLAAGLAGCSPTTTAAATATTPTGPVVARVAEAVRAKGAAAYLRAVTDNDPDWRRFLARVIAGDTAALDLAGRLRPAADAGAAEALDSAAAQALPVAPATVLKLTASGFSIAQLCTSPFIEPEAGVEKRYNAAAIKALDALPAAERLQPAFDECRQALEAIGKQL